MSGSDGAITITGNLGLARVSGELRTSVETSMIPTRRMVRRPRTRAVKRSVITEGRSCIIAAPMMRTNPTATACAIAFALTGCTPSAQVSVVRTSAGDDGREISGDAMKVKRGVVAAYAGPRAGYFVLREPEDWESGWDTAKNGPRPAAADGGAQMGLFAVAEGVDTSTLKIGRVVENATHVHAFVSEMLIGKGCNTRPEKTPFDAVLVRRTDKPVQFHVQSSREAPCGEAPAASLKCRVEKAQEWSERVSAQPGDSIECEATSEVRGSFAIVDRVLTLSGAPPGSSAKMTLTKGGTRGTFKVDVFGPYTLDFEAADDSGRRGTTRALVDATPPKTDDVWLQLGWGNLDRLDDPSTFPRVALALREIRDPKVKSMIPPEECAAESKNHMPNCELHTLVGYAHAKVKSRDQKVELAVSYQDERVEKGPMVCLRAWKKGEVTLEVCDRLGRAAGASWSPGQLDLATGKLFDPNAPPPAPPGDAGAPSD